VRYWPVRARGFPVRLSRLPLLFATDDRSRRRAALRRAREPLRRDITCGAAPASAAPAALASPTEARMRSGSRRSRGDSRDCSPRGRYARHLPRAMRPSISGPLPGTPGRIRATDRGTPMSSLAPPSPLDWPRYEG
jgi:hypothetical protein